MEQASPDSVDFADVLAALPSSQVWENSPAAKGALRDVKKSTMAALQAPLDFPPVAAAIVPGDRVALAVDPSVPQLREVIQGIFDALSHTEASAIDIVLWDEATSETIDSLPRQFSGQTAVISRHRCDDRASLRYLAADQAGDALYLNRILVDADLALPIVANRAMDSICRHDVTGVYPMMSDSATRYRHQFRMSRPDEEVQERNEDQVRWLLGVNLMITVKASRSGQAGEVLAGTPEAISKQVSPLRRASDEFPPPASLVIASLDGNSRQQTWQNAARGAVAASRYVQAGGTIVLWTSIGAEPTGKLQSLDEFDHAALPDDDLSRFSVDQDGIFPTWNEGDSVARVLARLSTDYRILMHSRLHQDVIESMGIGCVQDASELAHLCSSFQSCGVVRAAQFAGSTIDAPHRMGIET